MYKPGIVLGDLCRISHLILTLILKDRYYYHHFIIVNEIGSQKLSYLLKVIQFASDGVWVRTQICPSSKPKLFPGTPWVIIITFLHDCVYPRTSHGLYTSIWFLPHSSKSSLGSLSRHRDLNFWSPRATTICVTHFGI